MSASGGAMILSREGMLCLFRAAEEQSGIFFRTVTADRAVRGGFPSIEGSLLSGGRFNIQGEFGALYLSSSAAGSLAEAANTAARAGFRHFKPQTTAALRFEEIRLLDLELPAVLARLGLKKSDLETDWLRENRAGRIAVSQLAGRLARECGFAGVRIRSRIQPDAFNLAVFLDRIEEGKVSVICSDRLPKGPRPGVPRRPVRKEG